MKNDKMKNDKKMERMEQLKYEIELNEYLQTYEYALEEEISNREILQDVIQDILKF